MNPIAWSFTVLSLAGAAAQNAAAQPVVFTALNTVSSDAVLSPGSWVSIYGVNFAAAALDAPAGPLPQQLGGVSVSVGGQPASLRSVSPTQINALIPSETAVPANTVTALTVKAASGLVSYNIRLTRNAPAIFTQDGTRSGPVQVFDGNLNPAGTVHEGDLLIFYAAGLGPVDASGRVADDVEVYVGERKAQVLFAGVAPELPGVYQLNVIAPRPATDRLFLRSGGWQSNITSIVIQSGQNTSSVTGSIDGLYPSSDPGYPQNPCANLEAPFGPCGYESFSVMLHAASFSASFDIAASAGPIDIAAVSEAGASLITIDPPAGTYSASVIAPAPPARQGDFSRSGLTLWDYASCDLVTALCLPFPGPSILPASRIPPFWFRALQSLPVPNAGVSGPNGIFQTSGTVSGSRFVVDAQNNSAVSTFGGFVQMPLGPFEGRLSVFKLYVDGRMVAEKDLRYSTVHRCLLTGPICWALPLL